MLDLAVTDENCEWRKGVEDERVLARCREIGLWADKLEVDHADAGSVSERVTAADCEDSV